MLVFCVDCAVRHEPCKHQHLIYGCVHSAVKCQDILAIAVGGYCAICGIVCDVKRPSVFDCDNTTCANNTALFCGYIAVFEALRVAVVKGADCHVANQATNKSDARTLYSTNGFLSNWYVRGYKYDTAIGIKTGYTDEAGRCLASAAVDEQGRTFYCVVLGTQDGKDEEGNKIRYSFQESRRLLEWVFANFERITLLDENTRNVIREVPVTLSETDYVLALPVGSIEATMPIDYRIEDAEFVIDLPESVEAPVTAGTKLGTVSLVYNGVNYGTLDLVASDDVARSDYLYYKAQAAVYWGYWWVKALAALALIFIILVILLIVVSVRRGSRRRYSYSGGGRRSSGSYRGNRRRR